MRIIVDTNFLISCVKQKIDFFSQISEIFPVSEFLVPLRVKEELENLAEDRRLKVVEREAASVALQIIGKKGLRFLDLEGEADDSIVSYALNNKNVVVATLDRGIKKQLKNKAEMLAIRGKKVVSLE